MEIYFLICMILLLLSNAFILILTYRCFGFLFRKIDHYDRVFSIMEYNILQIKEYLNNKGGEK